MVVTDAYLAYVRDCRDGSLQTMSRYEFVTELAVALINKSIQPERRVSGRFTPTVAPEPKIKDLCVPIALKELDERKDLTCQRHQRACAVCGMKASQFCATCSNPSLTKVVCNTSIGRKCWTKHVVEAVMNASK